jgi:hypothetical protein
MVHLRLLVYVQHHTGVVAALMTAYSLAIRKCEHDTSIPGTHFETRHLTYTQ